MGRVGAEIRRGGNAVNTVCKYEILRRYFKLIFIKNLQKKNKANYFSKVQPTKFQMKSLRFCCYCCFNVKCFLSTRTFS